MPVRFRNNSGRFDTAARMAARPQLMCFGLTVLPCVAGVAMGQTFFPTENNLNEIKSADFNRDGWSDFALFELGGRIHVYLSAGDGTLLPPVIYDLHFDSVNASAADMDGDYAFDLVVAMRMSPGTPARFAVLRNTGDGSFDTEWSTRSLGRDGIPDIELADMDGDGDRDVVYIQPAPLLPSSRLYWIENDGAGHLATLNEAQPAAGSYHYGLVAGDLDGDSDVDVALTSSIIDQYGYNTQHVLNIMLNLGDGITWETFAFNVPNSTHFWSSLANLDLGDFDGDGDFDVVLANYQYNHGSHLHLATNDGAGVFEFVADLRTAHDGIVRSTDIDGDGDVDLLVPLYAEDKTRIALNRDQAPGFDFVNYTPQGGTAAEPCDIDDDGLLDLVTGQRFPEKGGRITTNPLRPDRPRLVVSALNAGQTATFRVSNLAAGAEVHFCYSLDGIDDSIGMLPFGGVSLDLGGSIIAFGTAIADEQGVARLTRPVPSLAPHATVVLQAVAESGQREGGWAKSGFVTQPIQR